MKRYITYLTLICSVSIFSACVYFNTFYNAKTYFSEAEKLRINRTTESVGPNITTKYKKVIEKADIVINHHSGSRYFDDALFLKGKSHYYRREYDLAKEAFETLLSVNRKDYLTESEYWLALIDWKSGSPQTALSKLEQISQNIENETLLAEISQARAEILVDLEQDSLAVPALEIAAQLTKNRREKMQLYQRLSEIAYQIRDYENAILHYKNVIKYSISNKQTMAANLEIVKRYRDLNDLEKASSEIQKMLADPKFSTIHAELELELAKLNLDHNDTADAIELFKAITVDYPKTAAAGEAYYQLGEHALLNLRDFDKAELYYKRIIKDSPGSVFIAMGNQRIKELNKFKKSKNIIQKTTVQNKQNQVKIDTSNYVTALYGLGELEAFHFNQIDTAITYFNQIVNIFPSSELTSKALFVLSNLYNDLGDTVRALNLQKNILQKYPDSEYAEYILENSDISGSGISGFSLLSKAEQLYLIDKSGAMQEYRKIAQLKGSEAALRALYFLANEYENYYFNSDSVTKYYNQIIQRFPKSEQATIVRTKLRQTDVTNKKVATQKTINDY